MSYINLKNEFIFNYEYFVCIQKEEFEDCFGIELELTSGTYNLDYKTKKERDEQFDSIVKQMTDYQRMLFYGVNYADV